MPTTFNQTVSTTATQTPTRAASTVAKILSLTQTQTPVLSRPRTQLQSMSCTNTQTPSIDPLAGIATSASGNESVPIFAIKVVDQRGTVDQTLSNAELDKITWTLNQPDEFEFHFGKNAYAEADVPAVGTLSGGAKEVQVYRNNDLLTWGPVIKLDASGSDGAIRAQGSGVDWYLNRRFVDGIIDNLLTNADFESGTGSWVVHSTTFTTDTGNFVVGTKSAKLVTTDAGADSRIHQVVAPSPNGVGKLVTMSAWFFIDTFTAPAFGNIGLLMEGYKDGVFQQNNWYPIDSATPRHHWVKASTTLWVPPNESWSIRCSLWGPKGTIHWDDCKVVAPESLSTAGLTGSVNTPVDVADIVSYIVGHVQSTKEGKSALNIQTHCNPTGVYMTKHYQYVDHVQFDEALREFVERDDGIDYFVKLTPKTRTFYTYAGKRGRDLTGTVTLKYNVGAPSTSNCSDFRWSRDASGAITRQTILGDDNGPDREQGEAADATHTGGVVLQDVRQAPQNAKTSSLQPLAAERLARFKIVPLHIEMDVLGSSGLIPTLRCGDLVHVNIDDGFVAITVDHRIMAMTLDCAKNVLTVNLTRDTLS